MCLCTLRVCEGLEAVAVMDGETPFAIIFNRKQAPGGETVPVSNVSWYLSATVIQASPRSKDLHELKDCTVPANLGRKHQESECPVTLERTLK